MLEWRRSGNVVMFDLMKDAARSFDPLAAVVDLGAGLDGFEDDGGRGLDGFGVAHDVSGGGFEVEQAAIEQASGVGVAVYDAGAAELVLDGNPIGSVPVEEVEFDVFAVFVFADFAFAGVAIEERGFACCELSLCGVHLS